MKKGRQTLAAQKRKRDAALRARAIKPDRYRYMSPELRELDACAMAALQASSLSEPPGQTCADTGSSLPRMVLALHHRNSQHALDFLELDHRWGEGDRKPSLLVIRRMRASASRPRLARPRTGAVGVYMVHDRPAPCDARHAQRRA
jgi:hypothetical protein